MMKGGAIGVMLMLLSHAAIAAEAENWSDKIKVSGTVETEWAVTPDQGDSQKFETIIQPELNTDLTDNASLTAILRLRADAYDKLEPGSSDEDSSSLFSRRVLIGDNVDAELREFYVDTFVGDTSLRLGKQQIVWGQADGLKVLDVVNPQSFREFILDEFDDSRIPLWTVNAEIPVGDDSRVQLLWIPDTTYHDLPERDGSYAFTTSRLVPLVPAGFNVAINEEDRPTNIFSDSDVGARFSTFYGGWDLTLVYLYHYNDAPVLYRTVGAGTVTINPEYERTHLIGGTASNAFGDFTLRSEVGYSTNSFFVTQNATDIDGVEESGEASYVIGLDYSGITDTFLSVQFFQSVLTDDVDGVTRDDVENTVTFLAERTFVNEIWKAETLFIHSLNDGDGVISPKLNYEYASNINVWVGADIFYGKSDGLFGEFNNEDRIYVGFEWGF
jgi:hypothetical protein